MMTSSKAQDRVPAERRMYCNRTLNLRGIRAIGYDMDYTLVHYQVEEWERRAYEYLKARLLQIGWPVQDLVFDPQMVCRGLVIDTERGNLLKTNRFGFVKKAAHGTQVMGFEFQREAYSRTIVDLGERRYVFLNTLFSLSEGCMYAQCVDLLDQRKIPEVLGYADLYERVRGSLDTTHMEGKLKADIVANPERFIILDEETPLALLDQSHSGKKLMLITNSEWSYTVPIMTYCFDRFLPEGKTWRDLFDVVVVGASKPRFFTERNPIFHVATEDGLLRPHSGALQRGHAYFGGSAQQIEKQLGLSGDEILYVGDHMFGDVHVSKSVLRWRTGLVLRELEEEIQALAAFRPHEIKLEALMGRKEEMESKVCQLRVRLQRSRDGYGPKSTTPDKELQKGIEELRSQIDSLDEEIGPIVKMSGELSNPIWGLLMRAGNDKSHLAYQVERYADVYTSRVSNFLYSTPYVYLRSPRGSLPHDLGA